MRPVVPTLLGVLLTGCAGGDGSDPTTTDRSPDPTTGQTSTDQATTDTDPTSTGDTGTDTTSTTPVDADGDGFDATEDCNDDDDEIFPGAKELCNDVDDDCDGTPDNGLTFVDYWPDNDKDGYGSGTPVSACGPVAGRVTNDLDCDDALGSVNPGATEICNDIDDDCDDSVDNGLPFVDYYVDADEDGYGDELSTPVSACAIPVGHVADATDCDDSRATTNPGAPDICNAIDDDCDDATDEDVAVTPRTDLAVSAAASSTFSGYAAARVTDGSRDTTLGTAHSWTNADGAINTATLEIDLGSSTTFQRIDVYTTAGHEVEEYTMEWWDGTQWQPIDTVTGNTDVHIVSTFEPVTTDRIRFSDLLGPAIQPGYARFNEVEVYANVAATSTPSASSTFGGYSAQRAVDGSRTTALGGNYSWTNAAGGTAFYELDFGTCRTVDRVELFTTSGYEIEDYDLEYWDGEEWVVFVSVEDNTDVHVVSEFTPVTSELIRVSAFRGANGSGYKRINELEVY